MLTLHEQVQNRVRWLAENPDLRMKSDYFRVSKDKKDGFVFLLETGKKEPRMTLYTATARVFVNRGNWGRCFDVDREACRRLEEFAEQTNSEKPQQKQKESKI